MMGTGKQLHNSVVKGPYFCYFRAGEGGGGGGGNKYVKFILINNSTLRFHYPCLGGPN